MSFGGVSVVSDDGSVAGVRFLLQLAELLVDRDVVARQLRELADAMKVHLTLREELGQREEQLLQRSRDVDAATAALAKAQADAGERDAALQRRELRLEESERRFAELRRDVRAQLRVA
jgi:hypothetical protein